MARCQVWPLSTETSTPPTRPPPESIAVPATTAGSFTGIVVPAVGEVMLEVGGVVSVEAVAGVRPDCSVAGCTPMSANRFTVACRAASSAVSLGPRSWFESSPQDHCTVPAPNTRAPLGARYSVIECVAAPGP